MPFLFEAAILSRMRSPVTSRSNWAKDKSTFRVSRPIEVVVLNCWVTETKDTPLALPEEERKSYPGANRLEPADLMATFDLYLERLGRRPLLLFDQFDDYA